MVNSNLAYALPVLEQEATVDESPVKWCPVTLSDVIANDKRLEATVFDVEATQARNIVEHGKFPVTMIGGSSGLATAYMCGRFKRVWVEKSDFPIYQPATIVDVKPKPEGYISRRATSSIDALRVSKGQILLTRSGTIGKVSFVSATLDNLILSDDLLRINCKVPEDAGYVYTFLKSRIGSKILLSKNYGIISHIEPEHLENVPIPNPPSEIKRHIHKLISSSYELRDESNDLIEQATGLLTNELQLPALSELKVCYWKNHLSIQTFNVRLSALAGRLDASYHVPIVDAITEHFRQYAEEVTVVGDERVSKEVILPGRFNRVYVEENHGRVFIGGKQLHELDPSNKKYLSNVHHGDRIAKQLELHENMTLITRSGTIGKVALVGKHWENWVGSEHIIRIVPANLDIAGYLYIFLASDYGFPLITRFTYGSVVDEIDDNHVRAIPIPFLKNREVQQQINSLALEANQKRYEAYQQEQEALRVLDDYVIFAK